MCIDINNFISVVIGGGVTLLATYLTLRSGIKTDLRKLKLISLTTKQSILENLINKLSGRYVGNMEDYEHNVISDTEHIKSFILLKSHHFADNKEYEKIKKQFLSIENIENEEYRSKGDIWYEWKSFNETFINLINNELESIIRDINAINYKIK